MKSYTRLTHQERHTIETLRRQGQSLRRIAQSLRRAPSTISREVLQHQSPTGDYDHQSAQRQSQSKQHGALEKYDTAVWAKVVDKLRLHWSPEQICHSYRRSADITPSTEWIYNYIWKDKSKGGTLHENLRHSTRRYRPRGTSNSSRGTIPKRTMIDQRPAIVAEKSRIGDWEIDTIIGTQGGPVLVSMVERKSRFTLIAKAPNKSATAITSTIQHMLKPYRHQVLTITSDNGKEFAQHQTISQSIPCDFYFASPYSPWQRALNENTNGLLRQYFPKKQSFQHFSHSFILSVQNQLNSRPRKCLDYLSPQSIFLNNPPVALAT